MQVVFDKCSLSDMLCRWQIPYMHVCEFIHIICKFDGLIVLPIISCSNLGSAQVVFEVF